MALPVGTILKVVCVLSAADGNIMQNVFNVVIGGSGGPFDADDLVDDMVDWVDDMYTNLSAYMRSDIDPSEVVVYDYDSVDDDWDEVGSGVPTFTTTEAGHMLPRGIALLVNAKTSDPDVNGKKFLGAMTELYWDSTTWAAALLAAAAAFAADWGTQFVGAASGATFNPAIWSPTRTIAYDMSNVFIIPTIAAYQRRRKPGVGA